MFFKTLGPLLARVGEVLNSDIRARIDDDFTLRQLDAIALVVTEVGLSWDGLFRALLEQNRVLHLGVAEATDRLGLEPHSTNPPDDPLAANADLHRAVAERLRTFHDRGDTEGAAALRARLREAAEVENRLLSEARAKSSIGDVRRV